MAALTELPPGATPARTNDRDPLPAEREALEMVLRCGIRFKGGQPMTAERAAEIVSELAYRIRQERSARNQARNS